MRYEGVLISDRVLDLKCSVGMLSGLEVGDFCEVVGQDAVTAPDSCAFDRVEAGSGPSVLSFQRRDASFGTGSPSDEFPEVFEVLFGSAFVGGFAGSGDRY